MAGQIAHLTEQTGKYKIYWISVMNYIQVPRLCKILWNQSIHDEVLRGRLGECLLLHNLHSTLLDIINGALNVIVNNSFICEADSCEARPGQNN